ncbi:FAD:protein FMN transferase [candidate division KSB1 bacterium]|nr:FAD:protein FMN transferase [candidate division KSB1 bacterium]
MKNKLYIILLITCLAVLSCKKPRIKTVEKTLILMDTYVVIRIYDSDKSEAQKQKIIERVAREMSKIEQLTTLYGRESDVARINREAGRGIVAVDSITYSILALALDTAAKTGGTFDVTIGPLMLLWGFGSDSSFQVPQKQDIQKCVEHVNYRDIILHPKGVQLTDSLAGIDLGGIAKGYAVDRAITMLKRAGVTDAQVDAGGDLRTIAGPLTAGKRNVWVRHPRKKDGFWGRFPMDAGAVATSGDYERYFEENGVRYHHILDPTTGFPATKCTSVTIKGENTALCDALSTAVFILGPEKGLELVERLENVECIILYQKSDRLQSVMSQGLKDIFEKAPR